MLRALSNHRREDSTASPTTTTYLTHSISPSCSQNESRSLHFKAVHAPSQRQLLRCSCYGQVEASVAP